MVRPSALAGQPGGPPAQSHLAAVLHDRRGKRLLRHAVAMVQQAEAARPPSRFARVNRPACAFHRGRGHHAVRRQGDALLLSSSATRRSTSTLTRPTNSSTSSATISTWPSAPTRTRCPIRAGSADACAGPVVLVRRRRLPQRAWHADVARRSSRSPVVVHDADRRGRPVAPTPLAGARPDVVVPLSPRIVSDDMVSLKQARSMDAASWRCQGMSAGTWSNPGFFGASCRNGSPINPRSRRSCLTGRGCYRPSVCSLNTWSPNSRRSCSCRVRAEA